MHYWSENNPHWTQRQIDHQKIWNLNVWDSNQQSYKGYFF